MLSAIAGGRVRDRPDHNESKAYRLPLSDQEGFRLNQSSPPWPEYWSEIVPSYAEDMAGKRERETE